MIDNGKNFSNPPTHYRPSYGNFWAIPSQFNVNASWGLNEGTSFVDIWSASLITKTTTCYMMTFKSFKFNISIYFQVIVDCVDTAANLNSLKRSVFALILLGRLDPTFCEISAKVSEFHKCKHVFNNNTLNIKIGAINRSIAKDRDYIHFGRH